MTDLARRLSGGYDHAARAARVFQERSKLAQERFSECAQAACKDNVAGLTSKPLSPPEVWADLTSRADSVMTRLASCAIAALVASARRRRSEKSVA